MLLLNNSLLTLLSEILTRMSGYGKKHSSSNLQNSGHVGVPPKCKVAQHRNSEESPQGTTSEIMPLSQKDIPRIIQVVMQSLADINSGGESTTSDCTHTARLHCANNLNLCDLHQLQLIMLLM